MAWRSSSSWTGSPPSAQETTTRVGQRSSFAAPSGPAASFSRVEGAGPDDAKAPGDGQVVVRRPARQLEQLLELLARQRLGREDLVGATGANRRLDVHDWNIVAGVGYQP